MRQAKYWIFLLPLFFVLVCVGAFAQANSEITGIVTDQTGAVVAGADVTVLDPATGFTRTTVSGPTGLYDVAGLNPANYNVTVTAKGFEKFVQTGVVVNVSGTFRVDAKLTLGAETQTVSVVADALAVQTDSNVVSTLINSEEISEIATENHNFVALAALGLGVSSGLPDSNTPGSVGSSFTISINGLRQSHNIWLIDGGESDDRGGAGGMQIQPAQDAIAEFQMLTSNYPPDYGISSGATISLSLKSGTKTFHGMAWEENRATGYDADTFFNKYQKLKPTSSNPCGSQGYWGCVPTMKYNIYGFNVGGPLYIPGIYNKNKNKTFFFWNEEMRKTTNLASSNNFTIDPKDIPNSTNLTAVGLPYVTPKFATVNLNVPNVSPTSWYQTAVLTPMGLNGKGCFNGAQPGGPGTACTDQQIIPKTLFDLTYDPTTSTFTNKTNAIAYLTGPILPAPTNTSNDSNQASVSLPFKVRDDIVRVDHNISDKWAILGHYIGDSENESTGGPELQWCWCSYNTLTSILSSPSWSAAIKVSGTITPNLLVEASINYDGNQIDITPSANTFLPSTWDIAPVVDAYKVTRKIWPGTGYIGPYSVAEDTATEPYHNHADDYEPKIDVSYTLGKQQFKAGASYNRYGKNQMLYGDQQGNYGFGQLTGDSLMDMLMGLPTSYSQNMIAPIRHYLNDTPSVYVNDNWHVTPRLTLQIGLRYDALPHAYEKDNYMANFVQADYKTGKADAPVYTPGSNLNTDPATGTNPADLTTFNGIPSYTNGMESPYSKLFTGSASAPIGLVQNDFKTWQPRIGFSDDLFGNGKTVLRGGFGTFYERMQGNDVYGVATSSPFDPSLGVGSPFFSQPGFNWGVGTLTDASALTFIGGQDSLAKTYRAPAVAQFSLGVQREVAPSIIWVIQYVGNIAWHQNVVVNINSMAPGVMSNYPNGAPIDQAGAKLRDVRCVSGDGGNGYVDPVTGKEDIDNGDVQAWNNGAPAGGHPGKDTRYDCTTGVSKWGGLNSYVQFPGYGGISQDENVTNGSYNGFQTGLRIQNRWGLSGELDYTWSHEIDITSYDRSTVSNPWNWKYDKGSGNLDRRHMLSANYIYKLPIATKSTGLVKTFAGGWELAGTAIYESGQPFVISNSSPYDPVGLSGGYTVRPNQLAKVKYHKSVTQWFDTTDFVAPTPSWLGGPNLGFGNAGKDAIVGPSRVNFTTSLYKSFAIWGTARLEARVESFNTFNHVEFNGLGSGMSCAQAPNGVPYAGFQTGTPGTGACSATGNYGQLTGTQDPRNLELGAKFIF